MIITRLLSEYNHVIVILVAYTIVITHILHTTIMVSYTIVLIVITVYHKYITNPNWRTHIFQRGRSTTNQLPSGYLT